MKKRLLLIGGSVNAMQIVRQAREMDIITGVADYYEDSACKRVADFSHCVDIFDTAALASIVKEYRYDGVITGYSDITLLPYAELCRYSGMRCYGSRRLFDVTLDKKLMKELCRIYSVPVMQDYTAEEIRRGEIAFPVVVKPRHGSGGCSISICRDMHDLQEACRCAKEYDSDGEIIVEQCALGREITIFYWLRDGQLHRLITADRLTHMSAGSHLPLPRGYIFPSHVSAEHLQKFDSRLRKLLDAYGFRDGPMYVQAFDEVSGIHMIEMGFRLTPSFENYITKYATGFDSMCELIKYAVGETPGDIPASCSCNAANVTLLLRPGIIKEYIIPESIRNDVRIIKVLPAWGPGHEIKPMDVGTLWQVGMRMIIHDSSPDHLSCIMDELLAHVRVIDNCGRDMVIRDYSYQDLWQRK